MKKIRSAVIGIGFIGAAHVEAIRRLGNVEVVALCDEDDRTDAGKKLSVDKTYRDYRRMIDECDLDFVHICTPNNTHMEMACYAMEKGVHVICEKPLAHNVREAEIMTAMAEESGLINAVNFHSRYYPLIREMKDKIYKGDLGKIITIHGSYLQDWLLYDTDYSWRLESEKSGSSRAVADIGSHWMDSVEYITGLKIQKIFADFSTVYPVRKMPLGRLDTFSSNKPGQAVDYKEIDINTEDLALMIFEFSNGAKGSLMVSQMFAGKKNQMTIAVAGTESALSFDTERLQELWSGFRNQPNSLLIKDPALLGNLSRTITAFPGGHVEGFPDAFKAAFQEIYRSFQDRDSAIEYATFKDGLREMRLCEAIVEAAQRREWVSVDN